ncbi:MULTISPECIES: F0F1 ATP synthase subunit delta [Marinobacter]|jgi:F-type H+-transporting ATPase subunit delta|uniref:ATP synthase subunit delta n=4 Tax=Marinobacter TaxID=2742 RepID=A0A137S4U3_9GAMM|nr:MULTISPECIES: F0F1 ATP synthase subunit delta [Marinobacter]WBU41303.1 F0F1 ATP synthase subunit delta [Marinobacter alkaliphilus]AMQ89166.1 ATP synthase F0F1 subunit delta [Marinobacter sp. LQ44]KXO07457.1 ATP synthase delta chain [Marinobacter excellens LAMA 842]MAO15048.1 F0F1 ATP synthase subunit delta [Marinobacter sp.]MCD1629330.1 F0F1 ATP synthase subunit delta [Marinobacter shengliensis]|tara:strand:+ start:518 stop:1054 length:537 start_codon:yes stop_codon:yes gene_type:complete
MAQLTTLARPYAKAVFDAAKEQNAVDQWDQALAFAGLVAADQEVANILANPGLSEQRKAELFADCFEEPLPEALRNFLLILAENKRLALLPEVATLFSLYRADLERTVKLAVNTAFELSADEQQKLIKALSEKLERKVELETAVDQSLIGGVVVRTGDLVIDASVRGKLARMAKALGS